MIASAGPHQAPGDKDAPWAERGSERAVILLGLDFGSTTSSGVAAISRIGSHRFSGEAFLQRPKVIYRSEPVFTPFNGEELDLSSLHRIINGWIREARLESEDFFSGGAIITGLAAARSNADKLTKLVRELAGEALIATADDPALESWLAFMGSALPLSRRYPQRPVLNLDIGGGTTNPALGVNGEILCTGCSFIGARHFRFLPGTYRLTGISSYGERLLGRLGLTLNVGDVVTGSIRERLLDWMVGYLEEMVTGRGDESTNQRFAFLEQLPLRIPSTCAEPLITFSGGVGELVYAAARERPLPGTTAFGDLGVDLARRIAASPILARDLVGNIPEIRGHATVYGLALHHTEISGTTLFMPHPEWLPLKDLPVVARLRIDDGPERITKVLALALKSSTGSAIQVTGFPCHPETSSSVTYYRHFGRQLEAAMKTLAWPDVHPLVLLLNNNCGKAIGNYATEWGRHPLPLMVLDEIPDRDAQFVTIGRQRGSLVPVSFFGMHHAAPPTTSESCLPTDTVSKTEE